MRSENLTGEDLERVKSVLDEALNVDAAERRDFVKQLCAGDEAVRREVESLLGQVGSDTTFLEKPFFSLSPRASGEAAVEEVLLPGQKIGPYQVLRELGRGGMGTVALAVREDDFNKLVALKLLRRGLAGDEVVRRFENERQILAQLEHPNVARILDGGTLDDGRPYFVMEYVDGRPVDAYCDEKGLSVRERLELFCQVCSALEVAHQNLVVHRDLKPGNILVTDAGVPKLLDFGIAKQLVPRRETALTRLVHPMTLQYASPEQIAGTPITTASDVYALGVLLFELLTGRSPYATQGEGDLELARAIREDEPRRPSTVVREAAGALVRRTRGVEPERLRRVLTGDLDSIVLKALRKEPRKRYGSVEQLSQDVRRHLEGRAVVARDGTFAYLSGKFVRRHKWPLSAVTAIVVLIVVLAVVVTTLRQRALAERERNREVVTLVKQLFFTSNPNETRGQDLTAREFLNQGEKRIYEEIEDPDVQAELLGAVGQAYVDLGHFDDARGPRERAVEILRRQHPEGGELLATALNNLATLHSRTGDYPKAERLLRETLAMKHIWGSDDGDLARAMSNLATVLMYSGRFEEAESLYREALENRREAFGPEDESVATSLRSLGNLFFVMGQFKTAEGFLRQALDLRRRLFGDDTRVASACVSLGRALQAQGDYAQAEELYDEALSIRRRNHEADHHEVADSELDMASLLLEGEEPALETARVLLTRSLATLYAAYDPGYWKQARAESLLGELLAREGSHDVAAGCLCESYCVLVAKRGAFSTYALQARERLGETECECGAPSPHSP